MQSPFGGQGMNSPFGDQKMNPIGTSGLPHTFINKKSVLTKQYL